MNKLNLVIIGGMTHTFATYTDGVKERFGGGAAYGAKIAAFLGIPTTVITLGAEDLEPGLENLRKLGIKTIRIKRSVSNNFSNDYRTKNRKLRLRSFFTKPFPLDDLPERLNCDALILFPGLNEITGATISAFNTRLVFLDIGGLTRVIGEKNAEGLYPIIQGHWKSIDEFRGKVDILKVSSEDLENIEFPKNVNSEDEKMQNLAENGFPIVLFTRGEKPTILARHGQPIIEIPTYKINGGDPAGAGEVFSVGFVCEYLMTNDAEKSVAFGNACASYKISGEGYNYEMAKKRASELVSS